MAQNEGFSCQACGAEFDTREKLDNHNQREHRHGAQSGSSPSDSPDHGQSGSTGGSSGSSPGTQQ